MPVSSKSPGSYRTIYSQAEVFERWRGEEWASKGSESELSFQVAQAARGNGTMPKRASDRANLLCHS
jgi:hypothetical protein